MTLARETLEQTRTMKIFSKMHKKAVQLAEDAHLKCFERAGEFIELISDTIKEFNILPYHVIWECVGERLPEDASQEDNFITLRNVTPPGFRDYPADIPGDFQLPYTGEKCAERVKRYFSEGKLVSLFQSKVDDGFSHFHFPIFSKIQPDKNLLRPTWILEIIYNQEDTSLFDRDDIFHFMEFISEQIGLAWDKFQETVSERMREKIDEEIRIKKEENSLTEKEELELIARFLSREFRNDVCCFFLVNDARDKLILTSGSIDIEGGLDYSLNNDSDFITTSYQQNRIIKIPGRKKLNKYCNLEKLGFIESQLGSPIEHCLGVPIGIKEDELGVIAFFRSKNNGRVVPPFSSFEVNLLEKTQRHIFNIILSHHAVSQREKDIQSIMNKVIPPLGSIIGTTEYMIKNTRFEKKVFDQLKSINGMSKIARNYISNFRKILEIDAGVAVPKKAKISDFRNYLIGHSKIYQKFIQRKFIFIYVSDDTPNNIELWLDKQLFDYAISNLLDNAAKYSFYPEERLKVGLPPKPTFTKQHKETGHIVIELLDRGDCIETTFSNYGLEVPEDIRDKIFDRGFRSHEAEKQAEGTGIGLYMSKKIIELHDGEIELVPNTQRYNTVFKITLPKG